MKTSNRVRYHLLLTSLALLVLILMIVAIWVGTVNYTRAITNDRARVVAGAASLAASQLNGDELERWLTDGADEDYYHTKALLQRILNNEPYVDYMYVMQVNHDGSYVIFDLISNDEKADYLAETGTDFEPRALGDTMELDDEISAYRIKLLYGERIGIYDINNATLSTHYEPVFDSDGNYVAHVCTSFSFDDIRSYTKQIAVRSILIALIFFAAFVVIFIMLTRVFKKADEDYAKSKETEILGRLFDQTATALANAIDAKDGYTHGHALRVAEYSKKIAELAGKSEQECTNIYYAALLHDVGKIGIPEAIITKDGKLNDEEYTIIKDHAALGGQVLESITEYPELSISARSHHERYDGKGYPDKLKGEDIPETARIIAVADSYDAMTSNRSYRDAIPQSVVREQFIECSGTQFDPKFANIMLRLIDIDTKYDMKERSEGEKATIKDELIIGGHRDNVSRGILINDHITTIKFRVRPDRKGNSPEPSFILFDSMDGRFHPDRKNAQMMHYHEYCEIDKNGNVNETDVRKTQVRSGKKKDTGLEKWQYKLELVKTGDHARIILSERGKSAEITVVLPDPISFMYIAFTGEHCIISDMSMSRAKTPVPDDYIKRIAEAVTYIDGPEGDIPNIQIDGFRSTSTEGIPLKDKLELSFHTKSLPTSSFIWHCPYCVLYSSDDGKINGENYKEYLLFRIDGETWNEGENSENSLVIGKQHFKGWRYWKQMNREGYDCTISIKKMGKKIVTVTENAGLEVKSYTEIKGKPDNLYVALTGDQVALTDIRIVK